MPLDGGESVVDFHPDVTCIFIDLVHFDDASCVTRNPCCSSFSLSSFPSSLCAALLFEVSPFPDSCHQHPYRICVGKSLMERVHLLGHFVASLDQLCEDHRIERVKTVGGERCLFSFFFLFFRPTKPTPLLRPRVHCHQQHVPATPGPLQGRH